MGAGMAEFIEREVETVEDFDTYCHYVAGLVGIGLSKVLLSLLCHLCRTLRATHCVLCDSFPGPGLAPHGRAATLRELHGRMHRGCRARAAGTAHTW